MIFVTAWAIGLAAGMTRSAAAVAFAAAAIPGLFAFAALMSGACSWLGLLIAIGGYNAGLVTLLGAHYADAALASRPR